MAFTQKVNCDICGKEKGSVNHWWIFDPPRTEGQELFLMAKWSDERAVRYKHACGQECLIKAVSEWMQKERTQ